jgi:hypothetical protein
MLSEVLSDTIIPSKATERGLQESGNREQVQTYQSFSANHSLWGKDLSTQ